MAKKLFKCDNNLQKLIKCYDSEMINLLNWLFIVLNVFCFQIAKNVAAMMS